MNRYCDDELVIPTMANALADVELGKNLAFHFAEVSAGIVELKDMIRQERINSQIVDKRQDVMIEMMKFVNTIMFKMKSFNDSLQIPFNVNGLVTDLEYANIDFLARINIYYHVATLTYDIASIQRTIEEEKLFGNEPTHALAKLMANLMDIKVSFEQEL